MRVIRIYVMCDLCATYDGRREANCSIQEHTFGMTSDGWMGSECVCVLYVCVEVTWLWLMFECSAYVCILKGNRWVVFASNLSGE